MPRILLAACFLCLFSFGFGQSYAPNTRVYVDALWFMVHAEDCPKLFLKETKKTMTLEEADRAGARIGSGGEKSCCFAGYQRKFPEKELTDDDLVWGPPLTKRWQHVPGCHRGAGERDTLRTIRQAKAEGYGICPHCIRRGPSVAKVAPDEWEHEVEPPPFTPPAGWEEKPLPTNTMPLALDREALVRETLSKGVGIQEIKFDNPVASMEHFTIMRFFFPVRLWRNIFMAYRGTGDERLLNQMLYSARHYQWLSETYPSVGQWRAREPEGLPYLLTMAMYARITLQLEREQPGSVRPEQLQEAESFLKTIVMVLRPNWEGNDNLDPEMGIPQAVADDFRKNAFNRSMNGIGTLAMITAALENYQQLKGTRALQPTIDRYTLAVREYLKYYKSQGHFCQFDGKNHFYYPYKPEKREPKMVGGCPLFKRPEDAGHYTISVQGLMFLFESAPELGVDEDFMTAVANAIHHNATTKIKKGKKEARSGYVQCPTFARERPVIDFKGSKQFKPAVEEFYSLQGFRDDMIDSLCETLNENKKTKANSDYDKRIATLYSHYMKAIRRNPHLVYLGN